MKVEVLRSFLNFFINGALPEGPYLKHTTWKRGLKTQSAKLLACIAGHLVHPEAMFDLELVWMVGGKGWGRVVDFPLYSLTPLGTNFFFSPSARKYWSLTCQNSCLLCRLQNYGKGMLDEHHWISIPCLAFHSLSPHWMVGCLDMVFTELTMLPNENKMKKPQNVSNRY